MRLQGGDSGVVLCAEDDRPRRVSHIRKIEYQRPSESSNHWLVLHRRTKVAQVVRTHAN